MYYQFTDDCLTGIPQIDAEHRHLFHLVNELQDILSNTEDTNLREEATKLLAQLTDYTKTHFTNEEAYMEKIHDPELKRQQQAHASFIARINQVDLSQFTDSALKYALLDLLEYLAHWLFQHILGSDIMIGKFSSPFTFTEEYLTGIGLIDKEHKRLFEIIADINELIHAELLHDKYDEIIRVISELKDYTLEHFSDEEAYMERIHYPGLENQLHAHTSFADKLNEINLDEIDENQQGYLEDLISFLLNWLIVHILKMDKKIGEYERSITRK